MTARDYDVLRAALDIEPQPHSRDPLVRAVSRPDLDRPHLLDVRRQPTPTEADECWAAIQDRARADAQRESDSSILLIVAAWAICAAIGIAFWAWAGWALWSAIQPDPLAFIAPTAAQVLDPGFDLERVMVEASQ